MNDQYIEIFQEKLEFLANKDLEEELEVKLTFGQRLSDICCGFLGSWNCIWFVTLTTALWMGINLVKGVAFDPYPFMLYTLIISVYALYGNSLIQLSNNRQVERDRHAILLTLKHSKENKIAVLLLHQKVDILVKYLEGIKK